MVANNSGKSEPLKICYLLETTDLSGGVRVVFDQARALVKLGHRVTILARHGYHQWYPYKVALQYVAGWHHPTDEIQDIVIGTFWTTIDPALSMKAMQVVHLCQGCEWNTPEYASIQNQIETVYAYPIPKVTIGDWLTDQIRDKFGSNLFPIENVGQIVDVQMFHRRSAFKRMLRRFKRPPYNILIVGMYEAWVKGITIALAAVECLRNEGVPVRLIRVATTESWRKEEEMTAIDAFYCNIPPVKLAALYQEADIFLAPSRWAEGFGLPFAEALASGIPAVASAIPSYMSLDTTMDYARFVPEGDPVAMATAARDLIFDVRLQNQLEKRGPKVINKSFGSKMVAQRLEAYFKRLLNG